MPIPHPHIWRQVVARQQRFPSGWDMRFDCRICRLCNRLEAIHGLAVDVGQEIDWRGDEIRLPTLNTYNKPDIMGKWHDPEEPDVTV